VHQLFFDHTNWHDQDLTAAIGGPLAAAGSGITSFADAAGEHIGYLTPDQHVHQLYYPPGGAKWIDQDLTGGAIHDLPETAALPLAAAGSALSSFTDAAGEHVCYLGADRHVHQLFFDHTNWHDQDLTAAIGGPLAAAGSGITSFADATGEHIGYLTPDRHVHQLYYPGGANWIDQDLIGATFVPHTTWSNWGITDSATSTGVLFTLALFKPTDADGISSAIIQAKNASRTVRAVGSGFSFSEASFPQTSPLSAAQINADVTSGNLADLWGHAGYTIDISGCNKSLQDRLASLLLPNVDGSLLYFTEAGITIHDLNARLDGLAPSRALKTMGGSDGQTIAGAIATGTHGADFDRGPLADSVRAIYLIGAGGVHHWIEPSNAITAPARVQAAFPRIAAANVHYDDNLFRSALVSVGAMGVVYAFILDVVPQYALAQLNVWTTWEFVFALAASGELFSSALMDSASRARLDAMFPGSQPPHYRALQIVVNPIRNSGGLHNCYVTTRFEIPPSQVPVSMRPTSGPASGDITHVTTDTIISAIKAQPEWDAGSAITFGAAKIFGTISGQTQPELLQSLINFCKPFGYYWAIRAAIDCFLQFVFPITGAPPVPNPQVNTKGFEIMTGNVLGQSLANQVVSSEAFFPYAVAAGFVQKMLAAFDAGLAQGVYPAGYLSLRACGPTAALLGMEQFGVLPFDPGNPQCTGAVEMALKLNTDTIGVTQQFETIALTQEPQHGNLHWGQSNGLLTAAEVQSGYPGLQTWIKSQAQLGGQAFINEFMQRCGLGR
jgi:hypothetical protein